MLDRYDQDLLLDYLEGDLDADRRAQLDAMLAEDPQLAALLHEMANDRAALRSLPEAQAPADLVDDVTKTLERRMLLDEPVEDLGPIPMSRGRAATVEPTRSISWGRVIGLTGLAASVALIAGVLVITFDDPLEDAANELAANTSTDQEVAAEESAVAGGADSSADTLEGTAPRDTPESPENTATPDAIAAAEPAPANQPPADLEDRALALRDDRPDTTPGTATAPEAAESSDAAGSSLAETFTIGATAAISAIQPRQQLVLLSESPEDSLEQLFEFCVANGIAVVQPEQLAQRRSEPGREAAAEADQPEANSPAEPVAYDHYALLINERQLDSLVQRLNNDVTLDPKRAGKASVFSNQAALLTDLPEDDARYRSNVLGLAAQGDDQLADVEPAPRSAEPPEQNSQQAIQLRKPDLGSPHANTRNAYNLRQQTTYAQRETPRAEAEAARNEAVAKAADEPLAGQHGTDEVESDRVENRERTSLDELLADEQPKDEASVAADPNHDTLGKERQRIDPARGNWLSAHLPSADTTPLLLYYREREAPEQTTLVPIMVQRAEPEQVNTLRVRQQVEYKNRKQAAEPGSDRDAEADTEAAE